MSPEDEQIVLRTQVDLPDHLRGQKLTLSISSWMGKTFAFVAGTELRRFHDDDRDAYRATGPQVWTVPAEFTKGPLELELRVRNTFARSTWLTSIPVLTSNSRGTLTAIVVRGCNSSSILGFGTLLAVALVFTLLYALNPTTPWTASVACACACAAHSLLFPLGVSTLLGPRLELPALAIAYTTGVFLSIRAEHGYYELEPPHRLWKVGWMGIIAAAVVFSHPHWSTLILAPLTAAYLAAAVLYHLRLYGQMAANSHDLASTSIVRWGLLGLVVVADGLPWFGIEPFGGVRLLPAGLFAFALLLMMSLARELVSLKHKNIELTADVADLNLEVRRLVFERSRALSQALARMSSSEAHIDEGAPATSPGTVIDGRYRVVSEIGAGAMGRVLHVIRLRDNQPLAMKVLLDQRDPIVGARFAREAQLAAKVNHPNVVNVVDSQVDESGLLFLVMEYVVGPSLQHVMKDIRRDGRELQILGDIASGLAFVHAAGIVHRDLKPANVLLDKGRDGSLVPKLADFGISAFVPSPRLALGTQDDTQDVTRDFASQHPQPEDGLYDLLEGEQDPDLTATGIALGTPAYLAPELLSGAVATPAADMFSFGVMARELLTGQRPAAFCAGPPAVRLAGLRPDVPLALATLIDACCFPTPETRPSADAMRIACLRAAQNRSDNPGDLRSRAIAGARSLFNKSRLLFRPAGRAR